MTRKQFTELNSIMSQISDILDQCEKQFPQPNGLIYLHGEVITVGMFNELVHEYNSIIIASGHTGTIETITHLPKYGIPYKLK